MEKKTRKNNTQTFIRIINSWGAIGLTEKDQKWYDKKKQQLIKNAKLRQCQTQTKPEQTGDK